MKPEILLPTKATDLCQGVDDAGCRRPRGANHHERGESISSIFGDFRLEILEVHLKMRVGRNNTQRSPSEPRHMRNLVVPMMGFLCQVNRWGGGEMPKSVLAIIGESVSQGDNDRRKIRLRSAAREGRTGTYWESEFPREPTEGVSFDLIADRRGSPIR